MNRLDAYDESNLGSGRLGDPIRQGLRCGFGGSSPKPAAPRDPGKELLSEFRARQEIQGEVLAAEQQYRPQYTNLDLQQVEDYLTGTEAGTREVDVEKYERGYQNAITQDFISEGEYNDLRKEGEPHHSRDPRWGHRQLSERQKEENRVYEAWRPHTLKRIEQETIETEGHRGLLDILEEDIAPLSDRISAASASRQREADIADVERLGPRAVEAWRNANPDQAELMDLMNEDAKMGLRYGSHVDPTTAREVSQSVRGAQASRGFGYGQNDAAEEALASVLHGEDLRNQRREYAGAVVGLNQATGIDQYQAILNRPGQNQAQSNAYLGAAASRKGGPELFGSNINVNDIFDSNFNAESASNIAKANNESAQNAGYVAAGSAIVGGVIAAW